MYRERYTNLLRRCHELGVPFDGTKSSYYFVKGITEPMAKLVKTDLLNRHTTDPDRFPQSVDQAFATVASSVKTLKDANGDMKRERTSSNATANYASNEKKAPAKKKAQTGRPTTRSKSKSTANSKSECCGFCGKTGHVAETCFKLKELIKHNGAPSNTKSGGKGNKKVSFKNTNSPSDAKKGKSAKKRSRENDTDDDDEDDGNSDSEFEDFVTDTPPANRKKGGSKKKTKYNYAHLANVISEQFYANPAYAIDSGMSNAAKRSLRKRSKIGGEKRTEVILDTGANIHIVNNRELLSNVKSCKALPIKGVSTKPLVTILKGDVGPFGAAHYLRKCPFNILSMSKLSERFRITYDNYLSDAFDVRDKKSSKLIARFSINDEGLYVLDATEDEEVNSLLLKTLSTKKNDNHRGKESEIVAVTTEATANPDAEEEAEQITEELPTLSTNASSTSPGTNGYTKEQKDRGRQAMQLHRQLGHVNDVYLGKLLDNQGIRGTNLSSKDVTIGRKLEGPCPACAKGKATVPALRRTNATSEPPPYVGHTYFADIVFIGNIPNIRICEGVTKYGTLIPLPKKDKMSLSEKLKIYFGTMLGLTNQPARVLRSDNEVVFSSISNDLAQSGIILQQSPSGNHCGAIEAQVRADRQALRTLFADLPYPVPEPLLSYAAIDIVRMRNLVPNSSVKNISPLEALTKRKPTMDDIALPWGTVVYATNPSPSNDKSAARAEVAIIVAHNLETKVGSVDVLIADQSSPNARLRLVNRPTRLIKRAAPEDIELAKKFLATLSKNATPQVDPDDIYKMSTPTSDVLDARSADGDGATVTDMYTDGLPPPVIPTTPMPIDNSAPTTLLEPQTPPGLTPPPGLPPPVEENHPETTLLEPATDDNVIAAPQPPPEPERTLRPKDKLRMPGRYINHVNTATAMNLTVKQAVKRHGKHAHKAIKEELSQIILRGTIVPIKHVRQALKSKHKKIIPSSMFLKEKYMADGTFEKLKARLVAGGHLVNHALYGRDETAAATIKYESLLLVLAKAAHDDEEIETYDFPAAYLNGKLENTQVMRLDKSLAAFVVQIFPEFAEYLQKDGSMLTNVIGALYGLPESGNVWLKILTRSLIKIGYSQSFDDPCLFHRAIEEESSTVCVHVDDMLHTHTRGKYKLRDELREALREEFEGLKNANLEETGNLSYLGLNIARVRTVCNDGKTRNGLSITMPSYVRSTILDAKVTSSKTAKTPTTVDFLKINKKLQQVGSATVFLGRVMKLMYLAKRYRFDILFACSFLATRASCPTVEDWRKLHRIYKYLNYTKDLPLIIAPDSLDLVAYVDASFAVHHDAKGHSGRIIGLGNIGGPSLVKSNKHHLVSRSSTESELISLADSTADIIQMRRILEFIGISIDRPSIVYQDNKSTIIMAETGRGGKTGNSKHIDVRYFFVKQHIDCKDIKLKYLQTNDMTADLFTKPLVGNLFYKFRAKLLNHPPLKQQVR